MEILQVMFSIRFDFVKLEHPIQDHYDDLSIPFIGLHYFGHDTLGCFSSSKLCRPALNRHTGLKPVCWTQKAEIRRKEGGVFMNWFDTKFDHVKVYLGKERKPDIMPLKDVAKIPFEKEDFYGERSLWKQPMKNGDILHIYWGHIPVVFRGKRTKEGFTAFSSVIKLIKLLEKIEIEHGLVDIVLADGDFYVLLSPFAFNLKPDPLFISWTEKVVASFAGNLPYDRKVFSSDATIPLIGSKMEDGTIVQYLEVEDLYQGEAYLKEIVYDKSKRKIYHKLPKGLFFGPYLYPLRVNPRIVDDLLPEVRNLLFQERIPKKKRNAAIFSVALAVKSAGGTLQDAKDLIASNFVLHNYKEKDEIVHRAFHSRYLFGYRSFAREFPKLVKQKPPREKSPFIVFERKWLTDLIEHKASYHAHLLLTRLLVDYHDYPRPLLPIPLGTKKSVLRELASLGIIKIHPKRQVELRWNRDRLKNHYLRVPAHLLQAALQTKQAIRFLHALLAASVHFGKHLFTNVKIETLAQRLNVSVRTAFNYLKSLRMAGVLSQGDLYASLEKFQCGKETKTMRPPKKRYIYEFITSLIQTYNFIKEKYRYKDILKYIDIDDIDLDNIEVKKDLLLHMITAY